MSNEQIAAAGGYTSYQNMVAQVNTALSDLEKLCSELRMEENRKDLEKLRWKLASHTFAVGVMGEFKRGKSTVINSLLEKEIMPADILPCSATMNRVTFDLSPHVVLRMRDGSTKDIPVEELASYVTKLTGENESRAAEVDEAVVYYPCRFCQNGVDIVDTPGLNDDERMNKISEEVIPKLDAVIMVLTPDNPFSMSEAEFVRSKLMSSDLSRLIFLVNKIDQVRRKADRPRVVEAIRRKIQTSVLEKMAAVYGADSQEYKAAEDKIGNIRVFPISALDALDGKMEGDYDMIARSGTLEFEEALTKMLTEERGALELGGPLNGVQRTSIELLNAVSTRKSALALSTQEFAQCQNEALEQIRELRVRKQEEKKRLSRSAADAKAQIEQMVIGFYPQLRTKLAAVVESAAEGINLESLKDQAGQQAAAQVLQAEVSKSMEAEMAVITEKVQVKLDEIIGKEAERLSKFISEVTSKIGALSASFGDTGKLFDGVDLLALGAETFLGLGIGGIVAGYKNAGVKGALVGGGISFAASVAVAAVFMTMGMAFTLPIAAITAIAGTAAGKFATGMIFQKDIARKKLGEIKKQMVAGIDNMVQEMQSKRELERWAGDLVVLRFDELTASMDEECERLLRDTEASMDAIKQDLTENELQRKQMEAACDRIASEVKKINEQLAPIVEKVRQVLEKPEEGADNDGTQN